MEIHDKIKQVREILGLSQSDVAEKLGTLQAEVSRMESGKKKFVPSTYIQFLIENGFDLNSFFDKDLPLKQTAKGSTDFSSLSKDKKLVLDLLEKLDPGHIVFFVRDRLDFFKGMEEFQELVLEASARLKGTDYAKRLKRLEAVTATLLLEQERKSGAPLFSENDNEEPNP